MHMSPTKSQVDLFKDEIRRDWEDKERVLWKSIIWINHECRSKPRLSETNYDNPRLPQSPRDKLIGDAGFALGEGNLDSTLYVLQLERRIAAALEAA